MNIMKIIIIAFVLVLSCHFYASCQSGSVLFGYGLNYNGADGSGCSKGRFGPYPVVLYDMNMVKNLNVRAFGGNFLIDPTTTYGGLVLNAVRNYKGPDTHAGTKDQNTGVSIEFPFQANKTYKIEMIANPETKFDPALTQLEPNEISTPVIWMFLDDNPNFSTSNSCGAGLHDDAFEKRVGKYSRLLQSIASPLHQYWSVKFSPLQNKNALKIIYDPSPADPNLFFFSELTIRSVKITEIPYEEVEIPRGSAQYTNVPRPPRGTPGYDILSDADPNDHRPTGRLSSKEFSIEPNQWIPNSSGIGYSFKLAAILPSSEIDKVSLIYVNGDVIPNNRHPSGFSPQPLVLPNSYQGNNFSSNVTESEIIISTANETNTVPSNKMDFVINYYPKS